MIFTVACSSNNGNGNNGGNTTTPNSSGNNGGNNAEEPPAEEPVEVDPLGKYDPPITITTIGTLPNEEVAYSEGFSKEDTMWSRLIEEELGIQQESLWETDGSQYLNRVNIAIATGEIPDIMRVAFGQVAQLVKADMIEDLTDEYEQYASPLLKEIMALDDGLTLDGARVNGKIMGVPYNNDFTESASLLWIRKDWLDKLGLEAPTTVDELYTVAKAFVEGDPNGNGQADEYGIAFNGEKGILRTNYGLASFFSAYGVHMLNAPTGAPFYVVNSEGKLEWAGLNPQMKDALTMANQMFKDGIFREDFGTSGGSAVDGDITANLVGMVYGEHWRPFAPFVNNVQESINNGVPAGEMADWIPVAPPGLDGPSDQAYNSPVHSLVVVKKGYENPEAVIKLWNLWVEMNYGERAKDASTQENYFSQDLMAWEKSVSLMPITGFKKPFATLNDEFKPAYEALQKGDPAGLTGAALADYEYSMKWKEQLASGQFSTEEGKEAWNDWTYFRWMGADGHGPWQVIDSLVQNDKFVQNKMMGAVPDLVFQNYDLLYKGPMQGTVVKIIYGEEPVDAWDDFIERWHAEGGDAMTEVANEYWDTVK